MEKDKLDFEKNIQVISAQNLEELFYFQKSVRDLYIVGAEQQRTFKQFSQRHKINPLYKNYY